MYKRILLLLVCALLICGSLEAAAYRTGAYTEEEALVTSFESSGADVLETTISCWTKLNGRFLDIKQIEAEMAGLADRLNLDGKTVLKNYESDEWLNKMVLFGSNGEKAYNIAVESVKREAGGETYIIIDVSMGRNYRYLISERQNIINALQAEEASINFSSCIIGTYKGRLKEEEMDKKSRLALRSIDAKKVEGVENDEFKSISAFSSNVGGYVMSGKARVNVQLAIRYSSYDDRTYIWIGTPLIPMEY